MNILSQKATVDMAWFTAIKKFYKNIQKLREAQRISVHFAKYFSAVHASHTDQKHTVFNIRHQVYCEELNFEPANPEQIEKDMADEYSLHCLLKHKTSDTFSGTVRVVRPTEPEQLLPIEKYCSDSITHETLHPKLFAREEICEISRLAVPAGFRRRRSDQYSGAATGVINLENYSEEELRCFPFIAIGLYLAAAATVINHDIKHTYVMMEPRLARSMSFVGIKFEQLGPVVDYHGQRAPYYINPHLFLRHLSPGFRGMFKHIAAELGH